MLLSPEEHKILNFVYGKLGHTATTFLTGAKKRTDVTGWLMPASHSLPNEDQLAQLRAAYEAYQQISALDNDANTQQWFQEKSIGQGKKRISPLEAIHEKRFEEVRDATTKRVNGM